MFSEPKSRREQKELTRGAVLEAARSEFERRGFERANLRDIARRAGVSAGTVLHHARDKRELLYAALFDELEQVLEKATRALKGPTLETRLSALAKPVFAFYARRPKLTRTLLKESLFAEGAWAGRFSGQVTRTHTVIVGEVNEAVARGELKSGIDANLFGVAWFSFFYFALIASVQSAHPAPLKLVEALTSQHLAAYRPAPTATKEERP